MYPHKPPSAALLQPQHRIKLPLRSNLSFEPVLRDSTQSCQIFWRDSKHHTESFRPTLSTDSFDFALTPSTGSYHRCHRGYLLEKLQCNLSLEYHAGPSYDWLTSSYAAVESSSYVYSRGSQTLAELNFFAHSVTYFYLWFAPSLPLISWQLFDVPRGNF